MNGHTQDTHTRYFAPVIWTVISILFFGALMILFTYLGIKDDELPLALAVIIDIPLFGVIVGVLIALSQRIKEIKGGEIDAARKY